MSFLENLFSSALHPWQWAVLALVPPLIVMLYFLKLKRQPVEVPSTYLWSRTIEDLHVNSIWQKLRQNLLLFLQLLLILLVVLACLRPGWRGTALIGSRFIFLIDRSASMSATDVKPNRLEAAKEKVLALIDQMKAGDVAMVISFSDETKAEQEFTDNRRVLRERVKQIKPSAHASDVSEALRHAAGLANPGRSSEAGNQQDEQVASALPATLYLFTDGGFPPVTEFSLGNLQPEYVKIGDPSVQNVAIVAFATERNAERPDQVQAFARIENNGSQDVTIEAQLYRGADLVDAQQVKIASDDSAGVKFELRDVGEGSLRLEINAVDALKLDNVAYAAINPQRPARVLCVTQGNDAMVRALQTPAAEKLGVVRIIDPSELESPEHLERAGAGEYDLVIYDRCAPKKMPLANTLFLGSVPPVEGWSTGEKMSPVQVVDVDRAHPLVQMPDIGPVRIAEAFVVKGPSGARSLIDAQAGGLLVIAPRESFQDCVLGFPFVGENDKGERFANTDWPRWYSFPIFFQNVLSFLGGSGPGEAAASVKPGMAISLRANSRTDRLKVDSPDRRRRELPRDGTGAFQYSETEEPGIYEVREGDSAEASQRFAVNLFDSRESNLRPAPSLNLGHTEVTSATASQPVRKELWKLVLLLGLGVLIFEWYVYNRRVYF